MRKNLWSIDRGQEHYINTIITKHSRELCCNETRLNDSSFAHFWSKDGSVIMVDGQSMRSHEGCFFGSRAAFMKSKSIDTVSRSSWFAFCELELKSWFTQKIMGWFGCSLMGISDTIAQAGSKIRKELIIHKPPAPPPKKKSTPREGLWS